MSESWKQWEGQIVNGEFPLLAYLGGSRHSAVFVTRRKAVPERVAIKLVRADAAGAEGLLHRWKRSAELNHPHLLRIFESGRGEVEGTPILYVVMEIAEEDLSQILPERPLSPEEVRQLLPQVLDALEHLHSQGMVHGRLRPSNIQAVGDQVKVSADSLRVAGERVPSPDVWSPYEPPESSSERLSPAADVWSLAITLVQTLTQQRPLWHPAEPASPSLPETTPEPFREIARRCLQVDPQKRWTVAEIKTALQPKVSRTAAAAGAKRSARADTGVTDKKKSSLRGWVLGLLGAAVVIAVIVAAGNKRPSPSSPVPSSEVPSQKASPSSGLTPRKASPTAEAKPSAASRTRKSSALETAGTASRNGIVKGVALNEVMPQVSPSAQHTIEGKIRVGVRVDVDPSGNVTAATLVSPGPSKYFARVSLEAAREWKFTPPQSQGRAVTSQWTLRFGFRRSGTEVVSTQTSP